MWTYTFLEARSGSLPPGTSGANLEVRYRLGYTPGPMPAVRIVNETMRPTVDTHSLYSLFRTGRSVPSHGLFNDHYLISSPTPLPDGLRLEVEQEYNVVLVGRSNGEPVQGKNKIAYVHNANIGTSVMLYIFNVANRSWRLMARA